MEMEAIVAKCNKYAKEEGVIIDIPIKFNNRLTATAGLVKYEWIDEMHTKLKPKSIEFSRKYFDKASEEEDISVICHEMTHYILFMKTGQKHGHDKMFKELNIKLGGNGSTYYKRIVIAPKYIIRCEKCEKCGKITDEYYRAGKVAKHPELYKSRCCGADLIVTQNF